MCMHVCVWIVYIYIHMCIYIYICAYIDIYICVCTHTHTCLLMCLCRFMFIVNMNVMISLIIRAYKWLAVAFAYMCSERAKDGVVLPRGTSLTHLPRALVARPCSRAADVP